MESTTEQEETIVAQNKMGTLPVVPLLWKMGLPMILSMVLQALYNVVDTMFVINMGADGTQGNIALSAAFPVQILMIAIGVGTGVGTNAMLSKSLGEGNRDTANKVAGNGLFLVVVLYAVFLLFGLFGAKPYMKLMSSDDKVIAMGTEYLQICCCASVGSLGFAVAERFLMSTGKTVSSMVAQVTGAVLNIVLDYVFIYPLGMGIAGAAYATIIGQIVSFVVAMTIHYLANKEIDGNLKYVKPSGKIIGQIYKFGLSAFLMQASLSVMMFGVLLIIGTIDDEYTVNLLSGSYGIYYKLMQTALFASFGLSNTLISLVSYNYGMGNVLRVKQIVKWGIIDTVIVTAVITVVFQVFAAPVSRLFALTVDETSAVAKSDILQVCQTALHIATTGYVFMGFSVAVQGALQGLGKVYSPLILSLLRSIVFVFPVAYLFTTCGSVVTVIWWTFPIAEVATAVFAAWYIWRAMKTAEIAIE